MNNANALLSTPKVQWGLLVLLCLFTFFINNRYIEPSLMEARNYVTAREILENDSWLIPTLNGEFRLAKPPLPTWITAIAAYSVGDIYNKSALRFPAAVMATLLVFFLYGFAKTLTDDPYIPFLAGAVVATSFYVVFMGRQGTWDIYCHSFMLGAILAFTKGWNKEGNAYKEFLIGGGLMGLSFMSKGPVAFYALLLPFLISYIYAFGIHKIKAKWKPLSLAVFICVIISSWWPLYVYMNVPSDLMQTVNTETTAWSNRSVKPFWHYWSFPVQSGVWTVFITAALMVPYARKKIRSVGGNYKFLFSWVVVTILLLSLVPEKKERYLMPALVSMALLTAYYVRYLIGAYFQKNNTKADIFIVVLLGIAISVLCLAAPYFLFRFGYAKELLSLGTTMICSVFLGGCGILFIRYAIKKNIVNIVVAAVMLTAFVSALTPYILDHIFHHDHYRYRNLNEIRNIPVIQDFPLYSIREIRPEEIWDVGRVVHPLHPSDTCFVVDQLPAVVLFPEDYDGSVLNLCTYPPLLIDTLETFRHRTRKEQFNWHLYLLKSDPTALQGR